MQRYDWFLIVLALAGLVCVAMPDLFIVLMFSFIGIPLAFLMFVLPGAALILGLARLLDRGLHGRLRGPSGLIAVGAVVATLAGVSALANAAQKGRITDFVEGDHDDLPRPLADQPIAFLSDDRSTDCKDFCQRLLLTGQATRFLVARATVATPDPTMAATAWHLERRATCPPVELPENQGTMTIGGEAGWPDGPSANLQLYAGIAEGRCLVRSDAVVGEAGVILVAITLERSVPVVDAGYSFGADLLTAHRKAVWLNRDGQLTERARWTSVSGHAMYPIAVPTIVSGYQFDMGAGFARVLVARNADAAGFDAFVSTVLGLRLSLDAVPDAPPVIDALTATLDAPGELDDNAQRLIVEVIDRMGQQDAPGAADRDLFLRLYADRRVDLPWQSSLAASRLLPEAPAGCADRLAAIGFSRLASIPYPDPPSLSTAAAPAREGRRRLAIEAGYRIRAVTNVLAVLPDAALLPFKSNLLALSGDRERREHAYELLPRIAAFGPEGSAALLALVDDADVGGRFGNQWQHPYLAGLIGLYRMGPAAASVLPDLVAMVGTGEVSLTSWPCSRLAMYTLLSLGASEEILRPLMANADPSVAALHASRAVGNAIERRDCSF